MLVKTVVYLYRKLTEKPKPSFFFLKYHPLKKITKYKPGEPE